MVIKQTSIVDVSVVEFYTTAISSSSIQPLVQSNAPTILSASVTKEEQSSEPLDPTDSPSMFSASMAPPRPTQAGQEEDLITTAAPTIKEDHEDLPDFDTDNFASENLTSVVFDPQHGDTSPDPQSAAVTEPDPTEEQDDLSVIEINTIQPDVPMPDPSLITEPLFAEGKTEETILIPGITAATSSDLTDNPTETTEVDVEEVFSESVPTSVYDIGVDEIETHYGVEALPPTQPLEQDFTSTTDRTAVTPPEDTYTQAAATEPPEPISTTTHPTRHAQNVQTATVAAILPDGEELTDDGSSSAGVQVFDESTAPLTDHGGYALMETDVTTEIDPEFFTSSAIASAASHASRSLTKAGTHTDGTEQSSQMTIAARLQHTGKAEM